MLGHKQRVKNEDSKQELFYLYSVSLKPTTQMDQNIIYAIGLFIAGISLIVYYGKQKPNVNDTGDYRIRLIVLGVFCISGGIIVLCKAL